MEKIKEFLTVVMPAYNEGSAIFKNALSTSTILSARWESYEILIVNDGSADNTYAEICRAAEYDSHIVPLTLNHNEGKGRALCHGTQHAKGSLVAFCDSDLDLNPGQLADFYAIMCDEHLDSVIGCKLHPDSNVDEYPFHRKIISLGYYLFLRVLFRLKVRDTQTGLKLFRAEAIKPVMEIILVKRFAFDIEVLAVLNSRGYRLGQAPIEMQYQRGRFGSRIKFKDIINMAWDTMAIFYRLKILRYYDRANTSVDSEKKNDV